MSLNRAAWYKARLAQLEVDDAPTWTAEKGEVLVKVRTLTSFSSSGDADMFAQVHAVSIQPVDWKVRSSRRADPASPPERELTRLSCARADPDVRLRPDGQAVPVHPRH